MTRIIVLGGAGDMGSGVVMDLVRSPVDEVYIGDINREAAERLIGRLGEYREKLHYIRVDAGDHEELVRVLRSFDVAVNTIGPFYEWGERVARASIEAGTNLVDICDDYDAAEAILRLSRQAEENSVTVITGLGWTPGITNVLVRMASKILDEIENVKIYWTGSAADSRGLAVIMHVFHAVTGNVPMYLNGSLVRVRAGSGVEEVFMPPPIGKARVFYTGHPEPVTIPRYIPVKRNVELKGGLVPAWQNSLARLFVSLRLTTTKSRKRRLAKLIHSIEGIFRAGGVEASSARVDVHGTQGGEPRALVYAVVDRMYRLTGIPASIGAQMLARGEIETPGVYPPEAIIEPERFLEELRAREITVLTLTEEGSWAPLGS